MTRSEFYEKYGNWLVAFSSYYKYTFTYEGSLDDGTTISCDYGGSSDQIYRYEVDAEGVKTVHELQPYAGKVSLHGKVIDEFYDY